MNGADIKRILQKDWNVRRVFRGVFACDTLPVYVNRGQAHAFIINIDPHYKPGSHWVALYIDYFGAATYFDSFGLEPYIPSIQNFILRNSFKWTHNSCSLQSPFSTTCGLYCIFFISNICRGDRLLDILHHFHLQNPIINERRIIALTSSLSIQHD